MSKRLLAVGLAVLLIVSMLIAFAPTLAHSASAPPSSAGSGVEEASHPAASVGLTLLNGYGYAETNYYPGDVGWGSLYFIVTDPLDKAVNVTITDPNATRDGVATPAYHYMATLNTTTSTYNSYTTGVHYAFPSNLPYAGVWTVNATAPSGGSIQENVTLYLYYTTLSTTVGTGSTLPDHGFGLFWTTPLESNGATLYTRATAVTLYGTYTGNGTVQSFTPKGGIPLATPSAGHGEYLGVVPANTTPGTLIHLEVSAVTNLSGTVVENESNSIVVRVGAIAINGVGITGVPTCSLVNDFFFASDTVIAACLQAGSSYGGAFTPISGLPVTVQFWNGTHHVTPAGAPTNLTTNATGEAGFTFLANSPPFIVQSTGDDALNFTVSVPGADTFYQWVAWDNVSWTLTGPTTPTGIVKLSLDHTNYYAGATATATWGVSSTNASKVGTLTATGYVVSGPNSVTYEEGVLNSTGSSGSFTFPILESMVPNTITVRVAVANATETFTASATATVLNPTLLLTPASYYYNAGSTTGVTAVLNGGGAGAMIQFQVWAYWTGAEEMVSNGTVANNGNIPVSIASSAPPYEVEVLAWATLGGQVVASSYVDMELAQGYSILLGVSTVSSYSDGSFQPGQTVTLSYQVVSVGGAALPQRVSFELFAIGFPYAQLIQNVGTSGSIAFTIPSSAPQGTIILELYASGALSAGTCFPIGECYGLAGLYVNPSPSALNLELGAGSGITVGWLILLILVALVAIVLFFVIRGRRRGPKPSSTSSGAASSPPEEWKGPTPSTPTSETPPSGSTGSDSQPPLPPPAEPPAGAS
ncbi:MAG TPA: hypothetical protein VMH38_04240 [Thermoplasmata archaeon]|nr:hypothetical protein [Thermoplasmata archaeon]